MCPCSCLLCPIADLKFFVKWTKPFEFRPKMRKFPPVDVVDPPHNLRSHDLLWPLAEAPR